jgi:hypothetical protein
MEKRGGTDAKTEGILLYSAASAQLDCRYEIQEHKVRIRTLDLDRNWKDIRADLLGLLENPRGWLEAQRGQANNSV